MGVKTHAKSKDFLTLYFWGYKHLMFVPPSHKAALPDVPLLGPKNVFSNNHRLLCPVLLYYL